MGRGDELPYLLSSSSSSSSYVSLDGADAREVGFDQVPCLVDLAALGGGWVGGWVDDRKVEEEDEAVRMSCWTWGGWVGG